MSLKFIISPPSLLQTYSTHPPLGSSPASGPASWTCSSASVSMPPLPAPTHFLSTTSWAPNVEPADGAALDKVDPQEEDQVEVASSTTSNNYTKPSMTQRNEEIKKPIWHLLSQSLSSVFSLFFVYKIGSHHEGKKKGRTKRGG